MAAAFMPLKRSFFSFALIKYLAREVLFTWVTGTVIFLGIMLLFQAVRLMEFMVIHQVSLKEIAALYGFLGVSFLPLAIPIALLFAVLTGISRANSEGELIALQSSGVSLAQVFVPIALVGAALSVLTMYLSFYTVPRGNRSFELMHSRIQSERVIAALKPGVFVDGFYGLMLLTEHIVPIKNELKRVFIYDKREKNHPLAITASAGLLRGDVDKGYLTLRLTDGAIHIENAPEEGVQQKIEFDVYDINLDLGARSDAWRAYSPPSYTLPQLRQRIKETRRNPRQNRELRVEYHRRFSVSFACLIFAALGFAIGLLSHRGARSSAMMLCLLVTLGYWVFYLLANMVAIAGWVPPWMGLWLCNAFFLGVAWHCYRRYVTA